MAAYLEGVFYFIKRQTAFNRYLNTSFYTQSGINDLSKHYIIPKRVQYIYNFIYLYPNGYNMEYLSLSEYVKQMRKQYNLTQVELS